MRLPNICFTSSENLEVNLDRWEPVFRRYGNTALRRFVASVMHQARKDWTVDRVDWRQLGIMVHAFLNNITGHAYHTQPPHAKSRFLKQLVNEGEYIPELFATWDPTLMT